MGKIRKERMAESPSSPVIDAFQKTFTHETFKRTLLMNRTETSWRWMHSGGTHADEFPSPASSEYHLPLAKRPKSAGISHFTAKENQRLHIHTGISLLSSPKKTVITNESLSPPKTPTDKDFQRVIDRLYKFQSVNYGRRIILTEENAESCLLDPTEVQYFKVAVAGKPIPLKVTLRRTKGKAVVYVSRTMSEPSELINDAVYRGDMFTIADMGAQFRLEAVYFAIQAITALDISVSVHFGKRKIARSDSSPRSRFAQTIQEEKWEQYRTKQEAKVTSPVKSFIQLNLVVLSPSSPKRIQYTQSRKKTLEQRRKSALVRRKSIDAERKKRTFLILHKQEIKQQEQEQVVAAACKEQRRRNCQKDWIRLIRNAEFLEVSWERYGKRKTELVTQARERKAAIKIQARFRCFIKGADVPAIALRHCRNALLIHFRHISQPFVQRKRTKLLQFFSISLQNSIIFTAASRMLNRSKRYLVILVQRKWRKWVQLREEIIEKMSNGWAVVMSGMIKEAGRAGRNAKKWKKKKDLTPAYLHIPAELKRRMLEEHLNKAKAAYTERLSEYRKAQEALIKGGKRAFAELYEREGALPPAPVLQYMPEKDEMRVYIDRAARLTLKSLKD